MRSILSIIIHCSATRPAWMADRSLEDQVAEIRRWHTEERGWRDIGYHFVVGRDGRSLPGRALEKIGAHTRGRNRDTIGICLIGGHGSAASDAPSEHFTPPQLAELHRLVFELCERFKIHRTLRVKGHNDYAAKGCPGFSVKHWLRSVEPGICRECGQPLPGAAS